MLQYKTKKEKKRMIISICGLIAIFIIIFLSIIFFKKGEELFITRNDDPKYLDVYLTFKTFSKEK